MKALLVQSPAISSWISHRQLEPPSISLATIAAQIDNHDVRVADAVVWRKRAPEELVRVLEEFRPDVVGFSSMTFQYDSTLRFAYLAKQTLPATRTVLGGYHASLYYEQIGQSKDARYWDALIRGEGDFSFGEYLDCLDADGEGLDRVAGLSFKQGDRFVHNAARPLEDVSRIRIPARDKRWQTRGFHMYLRRADVIETSRGCLHACKFCSIRSMYGKAFRCFPLERVTADIEDAYARGARHIFIVDDNITMDMDRFETLCDRIAALGHRDLIFTTQASPIGFARRPGAAEKMVRAGIVSVFLGIENVSRQNLKLMQKPNTVELIRRGVKAVQDAGAVAVAGIINGLEHDDLDAMRENFEFIRSLGMTSVLDQVLTPYPCTQTRGEMRDAGAIVNHHDFRWYDGYFSNVKTAQLSATELGYARWRLRREVLGMWSPTRGDWKYFKDYTLMWLLGMKQFIWLHERVLELIHGIEGRYKLQMQGYLQLNDFGIEIPGYERPATYHPVFGDATDPYRETRAELLGRPLDLPVTRLLDSKGPRALPAKPKTDVV